MARRHRSSIASVLAGAGVIGLLVGVGSVAATPQGRNLVAAQAADLAVASGLKRKREPRPGDHWSGCDDARAAGTAPIYEGEPGYRAQMDGDGDGEACEPYRG